MTMNIFDGNQIDYLLSLASGPTGLEINNSGPSLWDPFPLKTASANNPPKPPTMPTLPSKGGYPDMSGFANFGLQAPPFMQNIGFAPIMSAPPLTQLRPLDLLKVKAIAQIPQLRGDIRGLFKFGG